MVRVGVLGANGQVGSELCLLLAKLDDIELVPVCRTRSGSAFLRWQGIACRHGRPADPADAPRLLADCDLVLNLALAGGNPAQIRATEDRLIRHSFEFSRANATVVYFSTQSVYGDPSPGRSLRWRNPYGRAKLVSESKVRAAARRFGKRAFILRLGHVCGEIQGISLDIRRDLARGEAVLPAQDVPSNTVLTASILDAVREVLEGEVPPGTYDLMNTPQWTWRQVYAFEARRIGMDFEPARLPPGKADAHGRRGLGSVARRLLAGRWIRELLAKLLAHAPPDLSRRAQAVWYVQRARAEIAALSSGIQAASADHLSWVTNGTHPFPQRSTLEVLRENPYEALLNSPTQLSWPADLADATLEVGATEAGLPKAEVR
jgi:nucleoside-diphosphate-sugar epimerase